MRKKEYIKKKEYLDIYLSLMALFFLAPVFLTLVIAIKLDSPGPVFFKQKRVGIHQKHFKIRRFLIFFPSLLFFNKNKDLRFRKSSFVLYFILFLLFSFLSGFRSISSFSVQTVLFLSLHNIIVFSFLRSVLHTF